jgi:hypothetical protein
MNKKDLDKTALDEIHLEIHAARRIPNYKPSIIEQNVNKIIIERYSDVCNECKSRGEQLKNAPPKKEGFLSKLGDLTI